jgi:hypothetical protein
MDWVYSSGEKTAAALITTGPGELAGILVATDATNPVTLDIYDNTAASGKKLVPTTVIVTSATDRMRQIDFKTPVKFNIGLYVSPVVGGGGFKVVVYYK